MVLRRVVMVVMLRRIMVVVMIIVFRGHCSCLPLTVPHRL